MSALSMRLEEAYRGGRMLDGLEPDVAPADLAAAYAAQAELAARLGPVGGWKSGAKGLTGPMAGSALPASGFAASPARIPALGLNRRGVEVEVAFRFGRDLPARERPYSRDELIAAFDAVMPALEVVDSRFANYPDIPTAWQVADFQNHARLVLGGARPDPAGFNLDDVFATLTVDGEVRVEQANGNPAVDALRPVLWLVNEGPGRTLGIQAGQVVTTGTLTGLIFVPPGSRVEGEVRHLGRVEAVFD